MALIEQNGRLRFDKTLKGAIGNNLSFCEVIFRCSHCSSNCSGKDPRGTKYRSATYWGSYWAISTRNNIYHVVRVV